MFESGYALPKSLFDTTSYALTRHASATQNRQLWGNLWGVQASIESLPSKTFHSSSGTTVYSAYMALGYSCFCGT